MWQLSPQNLSRHNEIPTLKLVPEKNFIFRLLKKIKGEIWCAITLPLGQVGTNLEVVKVQWHRFKAALRIHLREHDRKAALSGGKKIEISLELTKTRLREGLASATYCNQEILSLTLYPLSHASLTTDKH